MEGLDAAIQHFRELGEVGDVADIESGFAQRAGGASSGDQFDVVDRELLGEGDEPGLVRDAEKRAPHVFVAAQSCSL